MNKDIFRGIRLKNGMTQQSLADLIGVSRSLIEAIEAGRTAISPRTKAKLAGHFEVDDGLLLFLCEYGKMDKLLQNK